VEDDVGVGEYVIVDYVCFGFVVGFIGDECGLFGVSLDDDLCILVYEGGDCVGYSGDVMFVGMGFCRYGDFYILVI